MNLINVWCFARVAFYSLPQNSCIVNQYFNENLAQKNVRTIDYMISCTPTAPVEPINEPDTVKSYIRAIVTAPGMTNFLWELRTPDTLSKGAIPSMGPDSGKMVREYPVFSYCGLGHHVIPKDTYFNFGMSKKYNLSSRDYIRPDQRVDGLRSWNEDLLRILIRAPKDISVPYSFSVDSLRSIRWEQPVWQERYVPSHLPGVWEAQALPEYYAAKVLYDYYVASDSVNNSKDIYELYSSKVERFQFVIEQYDKEKRRASGRFSFRVIGSINKEVIDVRDGYFENVRF